mgnify:CR=1 FL=1
MPSKEVAAKKSGVGVAFGRCTNALTLQHDLIH